jgi:DNA-binding response OmpR family regulator
MNDGKHVILYIDDDQDFLDSVRAILEANGYLMVEAHSAEAGLKVFKGQRPDLIIVDLMMEEVDSGTSLVKELRLLGNTAPIYMLSSAGDQLNAVTDYAELGLDGVFQKPIDPKLLLKTLKEKLA